MALLGRRAAILARRKSHHRSVRVGTAAGFTVLVALATVAGIVALSPIRAAEANAFEREVVLLVNQLRDRQGLDPLTPDARLFEAAQRHAGWMAGERRLSHQGAGESGPGERALEAGYEFNQLGEVLAQGQSSPLEVVYGRRCDRFCQTLCDASDHCDGWRQSPGHWNILSTEGYLEIGVGYHAGDGRFPHWWALTAGASRFGPVPLDGTPTPSPSPLAATATPTATTTPGPEAPATWPPSRTPTPTPSASRTLEATDVATETSTPAPPSPTTGNSATPTRAPSATSSPEPSATATSRPPLPTPTPTPNVPTASPMPSPTATPSPTTPSSATLRGRVRVFGGSHQAGTHLILDGQPVGKTDDEGAFEVATRLEGRKVLSAIRPGYLSRSAEVELEAGGVIELPEVELTAGDLHIDGLIDLDDLRVVAGVFGLCRGSAGFNPAIDFDGDGCIGWPDYELVAENFGRTGPEDWREAEATISH